MVPGGCSVRLVVVCPDSSHFTGDSAEVMAHDGEFYRLGERPPMPDDRGTAWQPVPPTILDGFLRELAVFDLGDLLMLLAGWGPCE